MGLRFMYMFLTIRHYNLQKLANDETFKVKSDHGIITQGIPSLSMSINFFHVLNDSYIFYL